MHGLHRRHHRFQLSITLVIISCIVVYNNIVGNSSAIHYDIIKNGYQGAPSMSQVDITQIRNNTCLLINSSLNVTFWPDVVYYGDLANHHQYSSPKPEEDVDQESRLTVQQFNQLRKLILTSKVLDAGYSHGGLYPARSFAKRLVDATASAYTKSSEHHKPLVIAIFGNSFTIGSNCGESFYDSDLACAWPNRLRMRMGDFFLGNLAMYKNDTNTPLTKLNANMVEWKMYQANGQNSGTIAQLLPTILHDLQSQDITLDAILLDNTIGDRLLDAPYFEAVIRSLMQTFPRAIIVSIVDATRHMVESYSSGKNYNDFPSTLDKVQHHYQLEVVDIAKMVQNLNDLSSLPPDLLSHPLLIEHLDKQHTIPDLLWPQSTQMITGDEKVIGDKETHQKFVAGEAVYFYNFLPKIRKFKTAYYPNNHPPWPTHQYVADSIMYALLKVWERGLGCGEPSESALHNHVTRSNTSSSSIQAKFDSGVNMTESIASMEDLETCSICLSPLSRIDAKSMNNIANFTAKDGSTSADDFPVVVTCGDWKWVTDERNRSGWQSDQSGSVIRFRLRISDKPTISLTYMKSHDTFGDLRVTFRPVIDTATTILSCGDIAKSSLPSLVLSGKLDQFTLWDTVVFPRDPHKIGDMPKYWELLNNTVLGQIKKDGIEYVDLYVENTNSDEERSRVKIQTVSSC